MAIKKYLSLDGLARFKEKLTATFIPYTNTSSGLSATNAQDAIDELNSSKYDSSSVIPIANGGTGATAVSGARWNLGTNIVTYRAVSDLGLDITSCTMDEIIAAMPDSSMLVFWVAGDSSSSIKDGLGTYGYGTMTIIKSTQYRVDLSYISNTVNDVRIFKSNYYYGGTPTWSGWVGLVTAIEPTEYEMSFNSGFANQSGFTSYYSKSQEGVVCVAIAVTGTFESGSNIFTMPSGFRPSTKLISAAATGSLVAGRVQIGAGGVVNVYGVTGSTDLYCSFSFVAQG